jgi:hypothetical protein
MPEDKMAKCRNCKKDRKVVDIDNPEVDCECGWNEAKAKAEVKKRKLMNDIAKEQEQGEVPPKKKSLFFN